MPCDHRRSGAGPAGDALRREAAILSRARHPGVVELRGAEDDGDVVTLITAVPTGVPLVEAALTPDEVAAVAAVLATTVADLHDIGVAHGAIDPGAVTVRPDGQPVLDDFSSAELLGGPQKQWARCAAARADDAALGRLVTHLMARCAPAELIVDLDRRSRLGRRPSGPVAAVLHAADDLQAGTIDSRRFAERVASETVARPPAQAGAAEPSGPPAAERPARTAGVVDGDEPGWSWPRRSAARAGFAALAAVATVLAAGVALVRPSRSAARQRPGAAAALCPAASGDPACSSLLSYANGVLTVGSARFAVGQPGDQIVSGRWTCGTPTIAVWRPRTAELWTFPGWPSGRVPIRSQLAARVPGGRNVSVRASGSCDELDVMTRHGTVHVKPWEEKA